MPKHVAQQTATDAELYLGNQVAPGAAPAAGGYLYASGGLLYGRNVGGAAVDLLNQGGVTPTYGRIYDNTSRALTGPYPQNLTIGTAGAISGMTKSGNRLRVDTAGTYRWVAHAVFNSPSNWVGQFQLYNVTTAGVLSIGEFQIGAAVPEDASHVTNICTYIGAFNALDLVTVRAAFIAGAVGGSTYQYVNLEAVRIA